MPVRVLPIVHEGVAAEAVEAEWRGGQFVLIVAPAGVLACGVVDPVVMERFGAVVAVARGTPECPLVHAADLLAAHIVEVTSAAAHLGITPGMTGAEVLAKLG